MKVWVIDIQYGITTRNTLSFSIIRADRNKNWANSVFQLQQLWILPLSFHLVSDSTDQLRLHRSRTEWWPPVRFLLSRRTSRLLPGAGHGGYSEINGMELRVYGGLRGKLWRERSRGLHADFKRSGWVRQNNKQRFFEDKVLKSSKQSLHE